MKIGSLFIALGFQVNGKRDLDDVERSVERAAGKALKLTVAVNAVNAALLAMLDVSARAGMALLNFERTTDLSAEKLQFWQHAAAVAGVGADVLGSKIKQLQDVRASFALNEPQNVGAWGMLGVDPRQDPFVVIQKLRQRLVGVKDVGVARALLGKVGLEELLPLLRSTNLEFEKWEKNFLLNQQQIEKLARLNMAWQSLKASVSAVRNQFAAALAPAVERLGRFLEVVAAKLAIFTQWLNSGTGAARVFRIILQVLVVLMFALGAALAALTAGLGALLTVLTLLSPALLGVAIAFAPISLAIGVIAAGLLGLVLILDDFMTAVKGGKSYFDWNEGLIMTIKNVNRLAEVLEKILSLGDRLNAKIPNWLRKNMNAMAGSLDGFQNQGGGGMLPDWLQKNMGAMAAAEGDAGNIDRKGGILPAWLARNINSMASAQSDAVNGARISNQTKIDVHVDGSASPEATGRAVVRSIKDQLRSAQTQAPAPSR